MDGVAEAQCGAAEVLKPAVDRLCRTVAGPRPIEEPEHVFGSFREGPAGLGELRKGVWGVLAQRSDHLLYPLPRSGPVGFPVGVDRGLVDLPRRFDRDVLRTDARVGVTLTCPTVWFPLLVASFRWW